MADFVFAIPLARDDLLVRTERCENQFCPFYSSCYSAFTVVLFVQGSLCGRRHHSSPAPQVEASGGQSRIKNACRSRDNAGLHTYLVNYYSLFLQDCAVSVQQQGAAFITTGGFDVLFSLLQEYHNQASWDDQLLFSQSWIVSAELFLQDFNFFSQAASSDLKQLGFSVATRGMENAVEELSQLLNSNSQLVESDDRWLSWRKSAKFSAERHQTSPYPADLH